MGRQVVLRPEDEEARTMPAAATATAASHNGVVVAEHPTEIARLTRRRGGDAPGPDAAPVLMFRNSGSGVLNVVYRRADGHVGWIDAPAG